jgi:hypothetical protein
MVGPSAPSAASQRRQASRGASCCGLLETPDSRVEQRSGSAVEPRGMIAAAHPVSMPRLPIFGLVVMAIALTGLTLATPTLHRGTSGWALIATFALGGSGPMQLHGWVRVGFNARR